MRRKSIAFSLPPAVIGGAVIAWVAFAPVSVTTVDRCAPGVIAPDCSASMNYLSTSPVGFTRSTPTGPDLADYVRPIVAAVAGLLLFVGIYAAKIMRAWRLVVGFVDCGSGLITRIFVD
jgi:hypothetical protein